MSHVAVIISGDFAWPPTRPAKPKNVKGSVAVRYVQDGGKWKAVLSWAPDGELNDPVLGPLPDLSKTNSEKTRFDVLVETLKGAGLAFFGGLLYEQFDPKTDRQIARVPLRDSSSTRLNPSLEVSSAQILVRLFTPLWDSDEVKEIPQLRLDDLPVSPNELSDKGLYGKEYVSLAVDFDNKATFWGDQVKQFFARIGHRIPASGPITYHCTKLGVNCIRYEIRSSMISIEGPNLRKNMGQSLHVSIDGTDRAIVESLNSEIDSVATISWDIPAGFRKKVVTEPLAKLEKLKTKIIPEVAWPFSRSSTPSRFTPWSLLEASVQQAAIARSSLENVEGGQPPSFLPWWEFESASPGAKFAALFAPFEAETTVGGCIGEGNYDGKRCSLSLLSAFQESDSEECSIKVKASFPGLADPSPTHKLHFVHDPYSDEFDLKSSVPVFSARVTEPLNVNTNPWQASIGTFGFVGVKNGILLRSKELQNSLNIGWPSDEGKMIPSATPSFDLQWNLILGVSVAHPERADLPWGDREVRRLPLIVGPEKKNTDSLSFYIKVNEGTSRRRDRHLVIDLFENSTNSEGDDEIYTVISRAPWSITRFKRRRLESLGDAENAAVATYDSDTRQWRLKARNSEYLLKYPPQSRGESADKPRRLEIHDLNAPTRSDDIRRDSDTEKRVTVLRPVPAETTGGPRRSYIVENRLTPSLDLWIRPSDLERGYILPEWALYELFRQKNDFGIGVALVGLRAEFLYGLSVGIDPSLESGPASAARVAEIEALLGRLPSRKYVEEQPSTYARELLRRWQQLRDALLTRHERLEIWSPSYDPKRPFVSSHFSSGVTFSLRRTALHRSPTGDEPRNVANTDGPRISTQEGLSGGALWGIESANFWQRLQEKPDSIGGTIERIAISPTGGDADQAAGFLNGRLKIISETRNGFLQRQRIEILGRVGAFWNRAKHVVIYERTVNPSEQFAPEPDGEGWHLSRSRRGIGRKVSEFIEILEPTRSYPDVPTSSELERSPASIGFLDSTRFNSKIIYVDSAWGDEVTDKKSGAQGYRIPLWNAGASKVRPNVYPMPSVSMVTIGEGKESRPLVPRQCANPENIYFYAQASGDDPDSNNWLPVYGVDYALMVDSATAERDLTAGGKLHGSPLQQASDIPEGPKPAGPKTLPGQHAFTWRLLPDGNRTMLNAGYGAKPVYGNLETITFSRGNAEYETVPKELAAHIKHAEAIASLSLVVPTLHQITAELRQSLLISDQEVRNRVITQSKDTCAKLQNAVSASNILTGINGVPNEVQGFFAGNCDELEKKVMAIIVRKRNLIARTIEEWQGTVSIKEKLKAASLRKAWSEVSGSDSRARLIRALDHKLVFNLEAELQRALSETQTQTNRILGEVETGKRILHDAIADADKILQTAAQRIQNVLGACSNEVKWSAKRYQDFRKQVIDELKSLSFSANGVITEASQRLASEISKFGFTIAEAIRKEICQPKLLQGLTGSIQIFELSMPVELTDVPSKLVEDLINNIEEVRQCLSKREQEIHGKVDKCAEDLVNAIDGADPLKSANSLLTTLISEKIRLDCLLTFLLADVPDTLVNEIAKACGDLAMNLDELLQSLAQMIETKVTRLSEEFLENGLNKINVTTKEVADICKKLTELADKFVKDHIPTEFLNTIEEKLKSFGTLVDQVGGTVGNLQEEVDKVAAELTKIGTEFSSGVASAQAYSNRVLDAFVKVGNGGAKSVPSNILRLLSTASTAPELGQLQANVDRIRCSYDGIKLQATKARATLAKLGDALKAIGIDVPFDGFDDHFEIPQELLEKYDINRLFPNFGGLNLEGLLSDVKVPKGVKDAVKISHDFDKVQFRAWVQVDVKVPIQGKKELFSLGPFSMFLRDSSLTGVLKAEASKDTEEVKTSGYSEIATNIDVEIAGHRMLSLEKVRLEYTKENGLKFFFDPKAIRLHAAMQFVQDTLGKIVGDKIGGLKLIKESGIPIGVEHQFSLPTISLMAGTSGISNIQLANYFRLVAYPEFVIGNRFNLSRPELPFIFSFFIVGGTGYLIIDTTYRPFDRTLSVEVEAAVGGSAALGFAFGPVSGSVFITLSLAITYRKTMGPSGSGGDGLTVSLVLVIAGNVSLWGIVDVYIGIQLRLSYRENGTIIAMGSLSVSITISAFITLSFRTNIEYKLRDGKSSTRVESSSSVEPGERIKELQKKAQRLQGARA